MNDCYVPKTGSNRLKEFYGVQAMMGDTERLRGWDLLTHGGFLTYPHHDAAGLCTYVTVQCGTKLWGYFDTPGSSTASRDNLFNAWDDIFGIYDPLEFMKYPLGMVMLQRGDTL